MSESNADRRKVILSARELEAMDAEINHEIARLGPPPTVDDLVAQGYHEPSMLNQALDVIAGAGRVITLLVAEIIQSGAALIIGVVFAILEYWRVHNGAIALGQTEDQSSLIAFAVVTANVVIPIYMLKQLRGRTTLKIEQRTLRGYWRAFKYRLAGRPMQQEVDLYFNPTLNFAASVLTYGTIMLAIYDLLHPLLQALFEGKYSKPIPLLIMELIMGLALSLAGVFFLQSAAHAIGARTLTDSPRRLNDVVEAHRHDYEERVDAIRREIRARHEEAKVARLESRVGAGQEPQEPKRLTSGSKLTTSRNRHARQQLAAWFKRQPPEVLEAALAEERSLRQIADESGIDKEVVRRYLKALKAATNLSTSNNGRHDQ